MTGFLDNSPIELTCPSCQHKFSERVGKLKTNPKLTCPQCKSTIAIQADDLKASADQIDKSIADLRKTLSNFGGKR
jgi:Zn finger protein HypA/HybF involved in hydrogenase expression